MSDILFKTDDFVFSYRVAGICIQDGKVLLQRTTDDPAHAFPGGHVAFGETHAETLRREFKEELDVEISVGELKWVGELFFPWGGKSCHQICLYYLAEIQTPDFPNGGCVKGDEFMEGCSSELEFHWVPLEEVSTIEVYPINAPELLKKIPEGVQHFIYKE